MENAKIILSAFFAFTFYSLDAMQLTRGWKGRAIPISYNKKTKEWYILLSHKAKDPRNLFLDFSQQSNNEKANSLALKALAKQTNNLIIPKSNQFPYVQYKNDWFHFIPVNFISDKELYLRARNVVKDDFMWIAAHDIIFNKNIIHTKRGKISLSTSLKEVLARNLASVLQQLNMSSQVQHSSQHNWLSLANTILFYESNKPYYEFTNFYTSSVTIEGKIWSTTEHYFQAHKFNDPKIQEKIRNLISARDAFNEGRDVANRSYIRKDWDQVKLHIMAKAVRAKFNQHQNLKQLLMNTGNKILVENAGKNDSYWGAGIDGRGNNYLGRILMHIRDELNGKIPVNTPFKP